MHKIALVILIICALCTHSMCSPSLDVARRESLKDSQWTPEEARWIRDHVGIIFYGDGTPPVFSQSELMDVAHALGVRRVKTWLKGYRPGEMVETLGTRDYRRICREFDTVLFDVCPDFMQKEAYDGDTVRTEYESVAYHLASKYPPTKTFLLSLFMETNLFFGTRRAHFPDFPVDRFFDDATEGVKAGIRRAREEKGTDLPRVYTVIEIAGMPKDFISRYLPRTNADLYAISYYGRGELGQQDMSLADCIRAVSKAVPHNGPFGKRNIILGELGRSVFAGGNDGADREQIEYLRKTLSVARENGLQYAFIFWLTDQERQLDDGWGLISSKPTGAKLRRAWHAFQRIFGGRMPDDLPSKPGPAVEAVRSSEYNPKPGRMIRLEIDVASRSSWGAGAASVEGVKVRLTAGEDVRETTLSLSPDEIVTLSAGLTAPDDSKVSVSLAGPGIEPITRTVSLERADLVIDRIYTEPAAPKAGDDVRLLAVVRNVGKVPISDLAVQFHVDDYKDQWVTWGCIWGDTKINPGESLPIGGGFLWKAAPGRHRIRAWANADGSRESNYSNNVRWEEVTVK